MGVALADDRGPTAFLRAGRFLAAERQEVLRPFDRCGDFAQQFLQVFVALDEVNFRRVYDQQVRRRVVKEEVLVGFDDFFEVVLADGLLSRRVLLLQPLLQHLGSGLQVNHQVRRRHQLAEVVVVAVVGFEFLVVEVQVGKQLVFFKNEIGDDKFLRVRAQVERLQLLEAPNQKRELRLKRSPGLAFVKRAQQGSLLGIGDALGVQSFREDCRQRALAHAYGTFNCNVAREIKKLGHEVLNAKESSSREYPERRARAIEEEVNRGQSAIS